MLLTAIPYIILFSAFSLGRDLSILISRISLSSLLLTIYINYNSVWLLCLETGLALYNGLYQCNSNSHIFNIFIVLLGFLILTLTSYYPRKYVSNSKTLNVESNQIHIIDKTNQQFKILEYSLIIIFVLCGAIFLMSANDLISVFISIELQSYGLYLLSSIYRNSESSTKAGLTYFLLGGLSSCIILLSQGLLYINSGTTNLENIYILSNINTLDVNGENIFTNFNVIDTLYSEYYTNISLGILSVGLLFKVSSAPFHFWSPDVYDGVPTIVTTFIAIIAKISIFIFLLELVHFTNNMYTDLLSYSWSKNLLISSLLSLIIGTVLGLTQFRIKRLYAYSTISHVGFILLALSINTTESIQAFIFYLIQYSVSNLNAFIILLSIGYLYINLYNSNKEYNELKETNNSPLQLTSQVKGLYKLNSMLALSFAITLFSFLGVPPLLGFFGKQMVLSASLDNGYIFMSLVAILTSVISAVYYLVVIKQIFFDENEYRYLALPEHNINRNDMASQNSKEEKNSRLLSSEVKNELGKLNIQLSGNLTIIISVLTLVTLIFMFVPTQFLSLVKILSLFISNV